MQLSEGALAVIGDGMRLQSAVAERLAREKAALAACKVPVPEELFAQVDVLLAQINDELHRVVFAHVNKALGH
jgi:hypothetical protein